MRYQFLLLAFSCRQAAVIKRCATLDLLRMIFQQADMPASKRVAAFSGEAGDRTPTHGVWEESAAEREEMTSNLSNSQENLVNPRGVPRESLLVDPAGFFWAAQNAIFVLGCGDNEPRLFTELCHDEPWFLISTPGNEQILPEHRIINSTPMSKKVISGVDASGLPLMWDETDHYHGRNKWSWFKIGSEDPVPEEEVRYPVRCWHAS